MSNEANFFKRIRAALDDAALRRSDGESLFSSPDPFLTRSDRQLSMQPTGKVEPPLLCRLIEAAAAIHLQVIQKPDPGAVGDAIVELALEKPAEWSTAKSIAAWDHPLIKELDLGRRLERQGLALTVVPDGNPTQDAAGDEPSRRDLRQTLAQALIGVTSADFCLADTATLVMKTRPGCARSVSLLPSIHVAVIRHHQILPDLRTFICLLAADQQRDSDGLSNCLTWISGPSKTADIEATLVLGAHGPREVYLFILP
jgi:L-lactate dehydrogenase complex protein LldG